MKQFLIIILLWPLLVLTSPGSDTTREDAINYVKGGAKVFTTRGHPKSHGINLRLKYPENWTVKEGVTPHVISLISSGKGHSIAIGVDPLTEAKSIGGVPLSMEQDLLKAATDGLIPKGGELISRKFTHIGKAQAEMAEFSSVRDQAGYEIEAYTISYVFLSNGSLACITLNYGRIPSLGEPEANRRLLKLLFTAIANSIILENQRDKEPHDPEKPKSSPSTADDDSWMADYNGFAATEEGKKIIAKEGEEEVKTFIKRNYEATAFLTKNPELKQLTEKLLEAGLRYPDSQKELEIIGIAIAMLPPEKKHEYLLHVSFLVGMEIASQNKDRKLGLKVLAIVSQRSEIPDTSKD